MKSGFIIFLLVAFGSFEVPAQEHKSASYHVKVGWNAYKSGDIGEALQHLSIADSIRPEHPVIVKMLAIAYGKSPYPDSALHHLNKLALLNAELELLDHENFGSVRNSKLFRTIARKFKVMNTKVSNSDSVLKIEDKALHPEGIAIHPVTGNFLISSIRQGKVISCDKSGVSTDFITDGLWAASGIKVDKRNNWLWVTTAATKHWQYYDEELEGKSKVLQIELNSGELLREYEPQDDKDHYFGDFDIQPGTDRVYITDSEYPAIYLADPDNERITLVRHFPQMRSLQGITFSDNPDVFYFSDYSSGVYRFNLFSGIPQQVQTPEEITLKGTDGLYYFKGSLIAIQNGVRPYRIMRLYLDETGVNVNRYEYLERANPALNEPTLGVFENDAFYYVANSPWEQYDRQGNLAPEELLSKPLIMKINFNEN